MTKKELLYVTTIAEMKSISKAAERLYIAQPSLSYTLQKIENELGVRLFYRTLGGLKPTGAGECYIETAYGILQSYKQMETEMTWLNDMKMGHLVMGTTILLGSIILPPIFKVFNDLYPNIEISIIEDVSQNIESAILKGDIDMGLFHAPVSTNGIRCHTLVREKFLLAVSKEDAVNLTSYTKEDGKCYLDLRRTDQRDYILTTSVQRTRQRCNDIFNRAGITPKIKYTVKSIQTATRLAGAGLGFTLVPELYSHLSNQDNMPNYYHIEEAFHPYWDLVACCPKYGSPNKPAQELITICQEIAPEMYGYGKH